MTRGLAVLALLAACSTAAAQQSFSRVTLTGRVVDAVSGAPVSSVSVLLRGAADRAFQQTVITDQFGGFVMPNAPTGAYFIFTTSPGYFMGHFGAVKPGEGSSTLVVDRDGVMGGPPTTRMWRHAGIAGTVRDEFSMPLSSVRVQLLVRQPAWTSWGRRVTWKFNPNIEEQRTDERGRPVTRVLRRATLPHVVRDTGR